YFNRALLDSLGIEKLLPYIQSALHVERMLDYRLPSRNLYSEAPSLSELARLFERYFNRTHLELLESLSLHPSEFYKSRALFGDRSAIISDLLLKVEIMKMSDSR